jgi:hypothetical protein
MQTGQLGGHEFGTACAVAARRYGAFARLVRDLAEGKLCKSGSADLAFPLIATIAGEPFMLARSVLQVPSHSFGSCRKSQHANSERLPSVFLRLRRNDAVRSECVVSHRTFPFGEKDKVMNRKSPRKELAKWHSTPECRLRQTECRRFRRHPVIKERYSIWRLTAEVFPCCPRSSS